MVPAGTPSRDGDVKVCVFDINQPTLTTPFYSVLVSISLLWPFHLYFNPEILPTTLRILILFSQSYFCLTGSIHLHFFQNLFRFFLCRLWLTHGSCVGPQNKIGHPAGCRFPYWVPAEYKQAKKPWFCGMMTCEMTNLKREWSLCSVLM